MKGNLARSMTFIMASLMIDITVSSFKTRGPLFFQDGLTLTCFEMILVICCDFFFDIYNLGLGLVPILCKATLLFCTPQDLTRFNCGHNFIIMVIMVITFIATVDAPFLFPNRDSFVL